MSARIPLMSSSTALFFCRLLSSSSSIRCFSRVRGNRVCTAILRGSASISSLQLFEQFHVSSVCIEHVKFWLRICQRFYSLPKRLSFWSCKVIRRMQHKVVHLSRILLLSIDIIIGAFHSIDLESIILRARDLRWEWVSNTARGRVRSEVPGNLRDPRLLWFITLQYSNLHAHRPHFCHSMKALNWDIGHGYFLLLFVPQFFDPLHSLHKA
ncbi:hypothetical protein EDD21DRAFT_352472 [Dissophora ornata]|nr:hypothetical protein EDD21DRAFT_352472 [Dissophora ornata]